MSLDWIIDDGGRFFHANSSQLRQSLYVTTYDGNLLADVVRNLGFVRIRSSGNLTLVSLQPKIVSETALAAALYFLAENALGAIGIEQSMAPKATELFTTVEAAVDRLLTLTSRRGFDSRCRESLLPPEQTTEFPRLGALIGIWRASRASDILPLIRYAEETLDSRYMVVKDNGDNGLVFEKLGAGLLVPDVRWHRKAIGSPMDKQPDAEYWEWAAARHRAALYSSEPTISDIETDIYWPGTGWVQRRYCRLLLPCQTPMGPVLFSANDTLLSSRCIGQRG